MASAASASGIGVSATTVADDQTIENPVGAELEGPLTAVDQAAQTIEVMGSTVDVSHASFASPTDSLTLADLAGEPLPGRGDTPGFLGGTAIVMGSAPSSGGPVVAEEVFVEVAENVVVGAVTENTVPAGGTLADGTFAVQGVSVSSIDDDRFSLRVVAEGSDVAVDLGSVPTGSAASVEGHWGSDGTLYAHTIEASDGAVTSGETTIDRAECDPEGRFELRGSSSTAPETVTIYDNDTDEQLGTVDVTEDPEGPLNGFRFRADAEDADWGCPGSVRVENTNGSVATADVDVDA